MALAFIGYRAAETERDGVERSIELIAESIRPNAIAVLIQTPRSGES